MSEDKSSATRPIISDLIAKEWAGFEKTVLPATAPAIQRKEMRLAFFGGAAALFHTLMRVFDSESEPTPRDEAQMQAVNDELDAFAASVGREASGAKPH